MAVGAVTSRLSAMPTRMRSLIGDRLATYGAPVLLGVVASLATPLLAADLQFRVTQWLIFGVLALSLSLVWGMGRLFSFGQTLFFGAGAYAYTVLSIDIGNPQSETVLAVVGGVLLGSLLAAALGYFMFYGGITDVYVAVVTLAATLVAFTLIGATGGSQWHVGKAPLGGYNGIPAIAPLALAGKTYIGEDMLRIVITATVVAFLASRLFVRSSTGRVAIGVGVNEERAELLGFDSRRYKLLLFVLAGAIAAFAGTLFAPNEGIVTPEVFGLPVAGPLVIWVMLGGRTALAGGIVGALGLNFLSTYADQLTIAGRQPFAGQTALVLGILLLVIVFTIPEGLLPALSRLVGRTNRGRTQLRGDEERAVDRLSEVPATFVEHDLLSADSGQILEGRDLIKNFDGVKAVNGVSLGLSRKGLLCLLGPNGAGKSTVFNMLAGRFRPTHGEVLIKGKPATRLRTYERARLGLGMKLQIPCVFTELSVRENLWLAGYAASGQRSHSDTTSRELIDWLGFASQAETLAGNLSHGQQQALEIAMVVATAPPVILLDEPTAGMTHGETSRVAALVRAMSQSSAVLVIEHDMDFVRALDCPIVLMVNGEVFAEGSLDELRQDSRVLDVYLGRSAQQHA